MSHQNWKTGRECHWVSYFYIFYLPSFVLVYWLSHYLLQEAGEVFDRRKDLLRLLEVSTSTA